MKLSKTLLVLVVCYMVGTITTGFFSGCQRPEETPSDNTTDVYEPPNIELDGPDSSEPENEATTTNESEPTETPAEPAGTPDKPAEPTETPDKPAEPTETPDKPAEPTETPAEPDKPAEPAGDDQASDDGGQTQVAVASKDAPVLKYDKPGDWAQWGGSSIRNNVPFGKDIPITWNTGEFDRKTGEWIKDEAFNIKWVSRVGSQTYGNPVVADGRVYIGTNNSGGYLARYPSTVDLGCLLCFDEQTGEFLWQHSSEKLPTGRVHDWPLQGICCAPLVEGKRLWFVTSRGEVRCLDTEGFYDGEDDGEVKGERARLFNIAKDSQVFGPTTAGLDQGQVSDAMREEFKRVGYELPETVSVEGEGKAWTVKATLGDTEREFKVMIAGPRLSAFVVTGAPDKQEADVIWSYDMMKELGVSQHNMCSCSVTALGDILFVNTSNGLDESHINLPAPNAPSFIAMDKNTGKVHWTDQSPGANILHGQWSSPTVAVLGGVPQAIFGGGDGWVYSFKADAGQDGKPTLLWKFDANPKESKWILGGRGTRNNIIASPVVYKDLLYVAVGQDPEHGEGVGHLWCIDPTKKLDGSDISPQLAMKIEGDQRVPIPPTRLQAVSEERGEVAVDNPESAVVWHFSEMDVDGNGDIDFEEEMHRSCGTVAIQDDLLFIADFSGLFHCFDALTGKRHWSYDMLAAAWGSPLIVDGHVYIGDEDGDVAVFNLSADPAKAMKDIDDDPEEVEYAPINSDENGDVVNMNNSVYSTPIVANNVLFIANKTHVFAIAPDEKAGE
ncbi:MAG: serine/threonine protein kinase [Blastopirellula sp.]|nr:serine/threonine protein kinase [Blastopirellula sp.]